MALPTLTNIYDATRSHLADDVIANGSLYTNARLTAHIQKAVRDVWRGLRAVAVPRIKREAFYVLAANQNAVRPSTMGLTDLAEPIELYERGGLTQKTITGATPGANSLSVTAVAHGFAATDKITLNNLGGIVGADGIWGISVSPPDTFTALGCIATGTYSTGGVAVKSSNEFDLMNGVSQIDYHASGSTILGEWAWVDNYFKFPPCTVERQLRVVYYASATVPTAGSDIVVLDDSMDMIALLAGESAAKIRSPQVALRLGQEGRAMLEEMKREMLRNMQRMIAEANSPRGYHELGNINLGGILL